MGEWRGTPSCGNRYCELTTETAQAHLHSLLPTTRYAEMAQALAAVTQLLEPLRPLATIGEVAAVFKAAETDRKALQEKVNSEMEVL